jgi:hypothetical protein
MVRRARRANRFSEAYELGQLANENDSYDNVTQRDLATLCETFLAQVPSPPRHTAHARSSELTEMYL